VPKGVLVRVQSKVPKIYFPLQLTWWKRGAENAEGLVRNQWAGPSYKLRLAQVEERLLWEHEAEIS
jgi:hypothetical protein